MAHRSASPHSRLLAVLIAVMMLGMAPAPPPVAASPSAEPELAATPTSLVNDGDVVSYAIDGNALFWATSEYCIPALIAQIGDNKEHLRRIPAYGGEVRTLLERQVNTIGSGCTAGTTFRSNLILDQEYAYWVDNTGKLVRLSRQANLGDTPTVVYNQSLGNGRVELAQRDTAIFALTSSSNSALIRRIAKADGAISTVDSLNASAARLAAKGRYVYWMSGGCVYRAEATRAGWDTDQLECGANSFYPEGERTFCLLATCSTTDYVFIGKGKQVLRHNNLNGDEQIVYTSDSANPNTTVVELTSNGIYIFLVEQRQLTCNPQPCIPGSDLALYRSGRGNDNNAGLLYFLNSQFGPNFTELRAAQVSNTGSYLFWIEDGKVRRLPADADAIPEVNMRVTGIELTQTIQDLNHSVRLIRDKRSFARVYVKSDGAAVSGVQARLRATWDGGSDGPISSTSPGGWLLTVQSNPSRDAIGQSFLFEIPLEWTRHNNLRLIAELNPNQLPPEPNYSDNSLQAGPFNFSPSPRLAVKFFSFGYELGGTTYWPRQFEDIEQSFRWIKRAYPISSLNPADGDDPGLAAEVKYVFDADLGARVDRSHEDCEDLVTYNPNGTIKKDDRNACAGRYIRSRMKAWRTEAGDSRPYFGWTSIAASFFTRGAAGGGVGSSPAGVACCGSGSWDFDGSITDWYTGHELGHLMGRPHPAKNADEPGTAAVEGCGHSKSDPNYPYDDALIGPSGGSLMGFDSGFWNNPPAVYPRQIWSDMMSYCPSQWISDYTYEKIYNHLNSLQANLVAEPQQVSGDWLSVFGSIVPSVPSAAIDYLRRLPSVGEVPDRVPGAYSLRLFNAQGQQIADYPFTPEGDADHPDDLMIAQVVPFVAGARELRVVRLSDGKVLTSEAISAQPPTVSNVALAGAPNPASGTVKLNWMASDPDGGELRFDILYSRDGGQSFEPLLFNQSGTSAQIDTTNLAGSNQARLRVVASDGVQSAHADSPIFVMANKPPQAQIVAPADGARVQWGTTVQLLGEGFDLQDGYLAPARLTWRRQGGVVLGTGPSLAIDNLPVGSNTITLEVTNNAGLKHSDSITIVVEDDLEPAGPTLSAAPTQIHWQVAPGSGQRTAQLVISNIGSGSLSWTASENASWLSLSASSGNTPAVLTLTANPAGLAPGSAQSTMLTISATPSGGPTQTIQIPVGLSVGVTFLDDFANQIPDDKPRLYLPLLRR